MKRRLKTPPKKETLNPSLLIQKGTLKAPPRDLQPKSVRIQESSTTFKSFGLARTKTHMNYHQR
ncbi:hypothetical protein BDZ97DRAFT_1825007 [Flammula alnicola]|nr:hypothetical protein BDZ97DRAFT_1825007 [Flammula alnicola]